jgi:hypothetical protein
MLASLPMLAGLHAIVGVLLPAIDALILSRWRPHCTDVPAAADTSCLHAHLLLLVSLPSKCTCSAHFSPSELWNLSFFCDKPVKFWKVQYRIFYSNKITGG